MRPSSQAGFPAAYVSKTRVRNTVLCDYVTRVLSDRLRGGGGTDWTLGRVHLVPGVGKHGKTGSRAGHVAVRRA